MQGKSGEGRSEWGSWAVFPSLEVRLERKERELRGGGGDVGKIMRRRKREIPLNLDGTLF